MCVRRTLLMAHFSIQSSGGGGGGGRGEGAEEIAEG